MEINELEEIGLTKNEGKAYQTLIEFGKLSAGKVSAKSGVPYSRIYNVLESLISKGLVTIIPEETKKFVATDPESFLHLIKDKEKRLIKVKEKIKRLKQLYNVQEKNPILVGLGRKAFYKLASEQKKPQKYAYSIRWKTSYKPIWVNETKHRIKNGIDTKFLVRYDEETQKDVKSWLKINKQIKRFDNEGVIISIEDNEILISLINSNATMLIRDQSFAKVMKDLFLASYKKAPQIK